MDNNLKVIDLDGPANYLGFLENHPATVYITNGADRKYLWPNGDPNAPIIPATANTASGIDDLIKISSSNPSQPSGRISVAHSTLADGVQFSMNYNGASWSDLSPFIINVDCNYVANFVGTGPLEAGNTSAIDTVYGTRIRIAAVPLIKAEVNSITSTLVNDTDCEIVVTFKRPVSNEQSLAASLTGWVGVLNGSTLLTDASGFCTGVKFTGHWLEPPGTAMPATHTVSITVTEPNAYYCDGDVIVNGSLTHISTSQTLTITGVSRSGVISNYVWDSTYFPVPGNKPNGSVYPQAPYLLKDSYTPLAAGSTPYATVMNGAIGLRYVVAVGFLTKAQIDHVSLLLRFSNLTSPFSNYSFVYELGNLPWLRTGTYQFDGPSGPSYPAEFYGFDVGSSPSVSANIASLLPSTFVNPANFTGTAPALQAALIGRLYMQGNTTPIAFTDPSAPLYFLPLGGDTYLSAQAALATPLKNTAVGSNDASFTVRIAPSSWVKRVQIVFNVQGVWACFGSTDWTSNGVITHVAGTDNYIIRWANSLPSYVGSHQCQLEITDLNDFITVVGPLTLTIADPTTTGGGGTGGGGTGGGGGDGCVPAGTPVRMADGSTKPAETLEVGDAIYALDEMTMKPVSAKIVKLYRFTNRQLYKLETEHGAIVASHDHRLYSSMAVGQHWVPLRELRAGDTTKWMIGDTVVNTKINRVTALDQFTDVFHVGIDNGHIWITADVPSHNIVKHPTAT
jgi:hypothetical protein